MAIVFITGTPGAGKSYYAVKRIVEDLKKDINLVVSNIDGIDRAKLSFYLGKDVNNLWTLDEFLATVLSFCNLHYDGNYRNAFLTILNVDYWKKFILPKLYGELGYRKVIFYLDEFQSIIDEDTELTQLQKFFFDYHRHLSLDFFIITQSIQRMNKAIRNIVEIELRLVNLRIFGISSMAVLKTIIGGVPVKKSIVKYDPKIFVLYRSALVEHMKGVRGRPPVMFFVALAVALFAIFQLGSYFKAHGGIIPKPPNLQKSDQKPQAQERKSNYSFFPSSSVSPSFSSPSPPPSTLSHSSAPPTPSTSYPSLPSSGSGETSKSSSGSGYIIIGNPSLPETPHRGDFELPSPKVKVIE
jgi:zona occludens toxin (predicted ATPase)